MSGYIKANYFYTGIVSYIDFDYFLPVGKSFSTMMSIVYKSNGYPGQ